MRVTAQWTDVGIFWATVGSVVVTALAVFVALFGPRWQERRKRPTLTVTLSPAKVGVIMGSGRAEVLSLRIHNEAGRDTARDVEVSISVYAPQPGALHVLAEDDNLNFDNPWADGQGRTTSTVPAGHARLVSVAVIEDAPAGDGIADTCGYLATVPTRFMRTSPLLPGAIHTVFVTVAGTNFDAVTYCGAIALEDGVEPVDGVDRPKRTLLWTVPPTRWAKPVPTSGEFTA